MTALVIDAASDDLAHGRETAATGGAGWRTRLVHIPLWGHLLGFALLLVVVAPIVRPGPSFTTDEGAYGLAQRALADTGTFAFPWKGAAADPANRWYPIINGTVAERGTFPYVAHPAYPWLLRTATAVAGETFGLLLVPLLGALGAAAAAWWLAEEVDRRLAALAFWLAALGPLFVNAWVMWAHAPGAALAGLSLVAVLRAARRGTRSLPFAWALLATVGGCLVRSENVIFAAGAAAAFVLLRRHRVSTLRAVVGGAVLASVAAVTPFAEAMWRASITGTPTAVGGVRSDGSSFLGGRITGFYHSFLLPGSGGRGDLAAAVLLAALAGLAVLMARRPAALAGWLRLATASCVLMLAGLLGRLVEVRTLQPLTGLVAAWPIVILGVAAVVARPAAATRALAVTVGLFVAGVLATQYAGGGGLEWGGRFFSPAAAPLAVLGAVGVMHVLGPAGTRWRYLAIVALVAVVAVPAAAGVVVLRTRHEIVAAVDHDVFGRHPTAVIVSSASIPRNSWRAHRRTAVFLVNPDEVASALATLRSAGFVEAEVVVPGLPVGSLDGAVRVERLPAPTEERFGRQVLNVTLR